MLIEYLFCNLSQRPFFDVAKLSNSRCAFCISHENNSFRPQYRKGPDLLRLTDIVLENRPSSSPNAVIKKYLL